MATCPPPSFFLKLISFIPRNLGSFSMYGDLITYQTVEIQIQASLASCLQPAYSAQHPCKSIWVFEYASGDGLKSIKVLNVPLLFEMATSNILFPEQRTHKRQITNLLRGAMKGQTHRYKRNQMPSIQLPLSSRSSQGGRAPTASKPPLPFSAQTIQESMRGRENAQSSPSAFKL